MKPPLISVITVCLNAADTIEKSILSFLDQEYPAKELIIIDGGSTDGTKEIIQKYKVQINHFLSEKDEGIADAMNKGIALATGDWIAFLNADDAYKTNALTGISSVFPNCDVAYAHIDLIKEGKPIGSWKGDHLKLEEDMSLCHPALFMRSDLINKLNGFNPYKYAMDYDLCCRALKQDARFRKYDHSITDYWMEGISNTQRAAALKEVFEIKNKHFGDKPEHKKQYDRALKRFKLGQALDKLGIKSLIDRLRYR